MHPFFRRSPGHLWLSSSPQSCAHHSFLTVQWDRPAATMGQTPAVTAALLQTLLRGHTKPAVTSRRLHTWAAQLCEDHASVQGPFMVMVQSLCIGFFDITGGLLAQGHCVVPPTHLNSRSVLQYGEHLSQRGFIFLTFVVWNNWHFLRNLFLHTECAGCTAREGGTLHAGELHQSRRLGK